MLSISLPLYRNKYKAAQRETNLLRQATESRYTDTARRLQAELAQLKHDLDQASRQITLSRKQSALTQITHSLLLRSFESGSASLSDLIEVQRQLLDYRLQTAAAIATFNTKAAAIRKIASNMNYEL
jgi:outer membrane protein TolC